MNIAFCIPTSGEVQIETMLSIITSLSGITKEHSVAFLTRGSCYIHQNRNELVSYAQQVDANVVIFIDSDMVFPMETFEKLLDHVRNGKQVVGVNYYYRKLPLVSTVKMLGEPMKVADFPKEPFPVRAVATGLMAIDIRVFGKIKHPYFFFDDEKKIGEDVWFCDKAREAGITVWCDPTIPVQHIGRYFYG